MPTIQSWEGHIGESRIGGVERVYHPIRIEGCSIGLHPDGGNHRTIEQAIGERRSKENDERAVRPLFNTESKLGPHLPPSVVAPVDRLCCCHHVVAAAQDDQCGAHAGHGSAHQFEFGGAQGYAVRKQFGGVHAVGHVACIELDELHGTREDLLGY